MKVKYTSFFYNSSLLKKICSGESNEFRTGQCFIKTVTSSDLVKLIGDEISVIVKIKDIKPKDCNGYHEVTVDVVKVVPGELEIEYDI